MRNDRKRDEKFIEDAFQATEINWANYQLLISDVNDKTKEFIEDGDGEEKIVRAKRRIRKEASTVGVEENGARIEIEEKAIKG